MTGSGRSAQGTPKSLLAKPATSREDALPPPEPRPTERRGLVRRGPGGADRSVIVQSLFTMSYAPLSGINRRSTERNVPAKVVLAATRRAPPRPNPHTIHGARRFPRRTPTGDATQPATTSAPPRAKPTRLTIPCAATQSQSCCSPALQLLDRTKRPRIRRREPSVKPGPPDHAAHTPAGTPVPISPYPPRPDGNPPAPSAHPSPLRHLHRSRRRTAP